MELTEQEQQLIDAIRENANDGRSATRIRAMAISVIGTSVAPRCWWQVPDPLSSLRGSGRSQCALTLIPCRKPPQGKALAD